MPGDLFVNINEQDILSAPDPDKFRASFDVLHPGVIFINDIDDFIANKGELIKFTFNTFFEDKLHVGLQRVRDGELDEKTRGYNAIIIIQEGNFGVTREDAKHGFSFQIAYINHGALADSEFWLVRKGQAFLDKLINKVNKMEA